MIETGFFRFLLIAVLTAVLAENFVFGRAFGVSTMITSARNKRNLPGICLGVSYFTIAASAAAWAVSQKADFAVDKPYIPLLYVIIIGVLYAVTLMAALLIFRAKFTRFKKYVHISAFNSVVMGTIFLSSSDCDTLGQFMLFGICAGAGFAAAAYMLSGVYCRLYSDNVPSVFRGYPAVMIFTGIVAMAVYGVLGHAPSYI